MNSEMWQHEIDLLYTVYSTYVNVLQIMSTIEHWLVGSRRKKATDRQQSMIVRAWMNAPETYYESIWRYRQHVNIKQSHENQSIRPQNVNRSTVLFCDAISYIYKYNNLFDKFNLLPDY